MKYLVSLLLLFTGRVNAQSDAADSIIVPSSLEYTVAYLSQDSLKGRMTGSAGATSAARFIAARFDSIGLTPAAPDGGWMDHYVAYFERKKIPAINVMAALPGNGINDTMVIFSAHYDHIGEGNDFSFNEGYSFKDNIFNGANDNASGVAALIELARYYQLKNNHRYQLLFVAFSGEEMGMLGSKDVMRRTDPTRVKTVINLEMLGRPRGDECFIVANKSNQLVKILNEALTQYQLANEKEFFRKDPYPEEDLFSRSDHYPFARKIKQAFTIMGSSPTDTYYHSAGDELSTIDFDFLLKATRNIALACEVFTR